MIPKPENPRSPKQWSGQGDGLDIAKAYAAATGGDRNLPECLGSIGLKGV